MYFTSFFRVPRGVAEAMDKIMRDILWDGANGITMVTGLLGIKFVDQMNERV